MKLKNYASLWRMFFNQTPSYLIFFVTSKCNSRCKMCFYWKNIDNFKKNEELTVEEIKKISKGFGHLQYLTISGGEPFLKEDLQGIVEAFVKQNSTQFVSVPTNGLLPEKIAEVSEEMFNKCPEAFFRIALSIDGIGKDHDKIRGVRGNFEKVKRTYNLLNDLRKNYNNFNIDATTVYSNFNSDKIEDIYNWVEQNMNIDNHVLLLARGDTRESIAKNISIEGYEKAARFVERKAASRGLRKKDFRLKILRAVKLVMREIIVKTAKENKMVLPCVAGSKLVVISETGKVYPCEILKMEMGDLRKNRYDIKKIIFSDEGRKVRKHIKRIKCFCTFECAIQNNIIYNPWTYPSIIKKILMLK